jgi:hypothetical protein
MLTKVQTVYCDVGHKGRKLMPWSEVCLHMNVQDTQMEFEVLSNGMVQLYKNGQVFSAPILSGEAGLYHNSDNEHRFYYHPNLG